MDLTTIVIVAYCMLTPLLILWAMHKMPILKKIGSIFLAYAVGCIVGLSGMLPAEARPILKEVANTSIPLAIPLMLFSSDVKAWASLAPSFIKSTLCAILGSMIALMIGFRIFGQSDPTTFANVGGMLSGLYTGGNANMASVKYALHVDDGLFLEVSTYTIAMSAIYIIFIILCGKTIAGLILPKFKSQSGNGEETFVDDHENELFYGLFRKDNLRDLAKGLILTLATIGAGLGVSEAMKAIFGETNEQAIFIMTISLISIALSMKKSIRETKRTFEAGTYIILIFSLAIASQIGGGSSTTPNPDLMKYTMLATFGTFVMHILLSAMLRIDTDTTLATSISLICSPPFVPVIASKLKNRSIIGPGIAVGLFGYAAGTYIGFAIANLLLMLA